MIHSNHLERVRRLYISWRFPLKLLDALFQSRNQHIRLHNVEHNGINLSNESSSVYFDWCGPPLDVLLPDLCESGVVSPLERSPTRPNIKVSYALGHYPLFWGRKIAIHFYSLRHKARCKHIVWLLRCRDGLHPQSDTLLI